MFPLVDSVHRFVTHAFVLGIRLWDVSQRALRYFTGLTVSPGLLPTRLCFASGSGMFRSGSSDVSPG